MRVECGVAVVLPSSRCHFSPRVVLHESFSAETWAWEMFCCKGVGVLARSLTLTRAELRGLNNRLFLPFHPVAEEPRAAAAAGFQSSAWCHSTIPSCGSIVCFNSYLILEKHKVVFGCFIVRCVRWPCPGSWCVKVRACSRRGALASRPSFIAVTFSTPFEIRARSSKHGAAADAAAFLSFNRGAPPAAAVAPLHGRHARQSRRCCGCEQRHDAGRWRQQLAPQLHGSSQEGFSRAVVQLRRGEEALRDLPVDPAGATDEARWVWRDPNYIEAIMLHTWLVWLRPLH